MPVETNAQRELRLFKLQFEKAGLADVGLALERWVTTGDEAARAVALAAAPRAAKAAGPDWARPLALARDDEDTDRLFVVAAAGFVEASAWLSWATSSLRMTGRIAAAARQLQRSAGLTVKTPPIPWSTLTYRPPPQVYFPLLDVLLEAVTVAHPELVEAAKTWVSAGFFDRDKPAADEYAAMLAGTASRLLPWELEKLAAPPLGVPFAKFKAIWPAADVDAWLERGDEAALARLEHKASKDEYSWNELARSGMNDLPEATRARALRLALTAKPEPKLLAWVLLKGSLDWVEAFHSWLAASQGRAFSPFARTAELSENGRQLCAQLLLALENDRPRYLVALDALEAVPAFLFGILEAMGARKRELGTLIALHRGSVVIERRPKKREFVFRVSVFETEAEAETHVASLKYEAPPATAGKVKLVSREGMVSLWVDAKLDPKGTLDGAGGPVGGFDQDAWGVVHGPPQEAIFKLSHANSFAAAAIARATELGLTAPARVDALYGALLPVEPGKKKYGWFLGSFPYSR